MMMNENNGNNWFLALCGTNHRLTALNERAPLALSHDDLANGHLELMNFGNVFEAVAVSTCNRIEFYLVLPVGVDPFNVVKHFYINFRKLDISELEDKFYVKTELDAVEHLFRVSAGLDSMVLGETQVFGQVKEAYSSACMIKSAGKIIHRMFHQAFRTGKQIRTETDLQQGVSSVSGAAMQLLKKHLDGNHSLPVILIGVNEMIHISAGHLMKSGYNNLIFVNRTESRAHEMSNKYGGSGKPLSELKNILPDAHVVITCTGAPEAIIDRGMLTDAIEKSDSKLTILDMAIPRDVAVPETTDQRLQLLDLEDVDQYLKEKQQVREDSVPKAEGLIRRRIEEFRYWYEHAKHEPLTERVEHALERIRREEIAEISRDLDDDTSKKIEEFSHRLIDRLLKTKRRCKKGKQVS